METVCIFIYVWLYLYTYTFLASIRIIISFFADKTLIGYVLSKYLFSMVNTHRALCCIISNKYGEDFE